MKSNHDRVCVDTVYDTIEAELIRGRLAAEGITSWLQSDDAGGSLGYLTVTLGIAIMVSRDEGERAYRILYPNNLKH